VNTGDLVDGTDGINYLASPVEAEWIMYQGFLDAAGMSADYYFDVIGNHDAYGDENAAHYLGWSMQGQAQGTTQPQWRLDLPFGSYHFLGLATTCNDWLPWWNDNMEITDVEYNELTANLDANADANLTIALGHHDYIVSRAGQSVIGGTGVDDLFVDYGVPYYIHGHEHDYHCRLSEGGVVIQRVASMGQSTTSNFCVHAVDSDCISHACTAAGGEAWPLIVVTAPVDARLGTDDEVDNPYAPGVPSTCTAAPIRALVFDETDPTTVTFYWDSGLTGGMSRSGTMPEQWLGTFDATGLGPGLHTLTVEAIGSRTRETAIQVLLEDRECDLTTPPVDDDGAEEPVEPLPETADTAEVVPDASEDVPADVTVDGAEDGSDDVGDDETDGDMSEGGCSCRMI
jgi:hypothetical protein